MIVHSCLRVSINLNMPPSDEEGGFCVAKDGGRENALIKPFPTTPQSAPQTAPLTSGAENKLFREADKSDSSLLLCCYEANFNLKRSLSLIIAINSELVGLPRLVCTV